MNSGQTDRDDSIREFDAPELLAPAGNWQCAEAAIENGADAIYFGVDRGFNARHRAANFGLGDLPDVMKLLRSRDVRGYVTLNTLVFPDELDSLIEVVEAIAEAGVDAVLVQDFGVARIVKAMCEELEIHASTQMSLTSAETIVVAERLGLSRVVLARELSVAEIRKIRGASTMPLEAFIHGALCVAYSGQCLTSESLGGRSANRGQCAQACRLPYELVCDGEDRDFGEVRYLLSPQDLAGYAAIPDMIAAGINSLKIEGRLKTPEYVANITHHYRRGIDEAIRKGTARLSLAQQQEMELSFSRGFSPGWLEGNDHKRLVPGIRAAKQGIELGEVIDIREDAIRITTGAALALGDGLAIASAPIQQRHSQDAYHGSGFADHHQGGRIYSLDNAGISHRKTTAKKRLKTVDRGDDVWVGFGRGDIDFGRIEIGATVFKNDDPRLNKRLAKSFSGKPSRTRPLRFHVHAKTGQPFRLTGTTGNHNVDVVCDGMLEVASKHAITLEVLKDKLGRLGGTIFHLDGVKATIDGSPMVPLGLLNQARRDVVEKLFGLCEHSSVREIRVDLARKLTEKVTAADTGNHPAKLSVLCRTKEQLEVAAQSEAAEVIADFHDVREHREAIEIARSHGKPIFLATIRMQKPGEMGLIKQIIKYAPDGVLSRNLAALVASVEAGLPTIADFSLNVANQRSAEWIRSLGAQRLTASYDLNADQLVQLTDAIPSEWFEIVIHQHMPMFHMEHCVFCSLLSPGTNKTNCGRPCDDHVVQLRDRVGKLHTLQADIACRNTLYNATPQSGADLVSMLTGKGVANYRIELLEEDAVRTGETISLYGQLLAGKIDGSQVWRQLSAENRVGVTRGTLEAKRNPLAIL